MNLDRSLLRVLLIFNCVALIGCVGRAPSRFAGLSPTQARALAQQLAHSHDEELQADLRSAFQNHPPANVLVLSGGDAHGAFGCGVLAGWRSSPTDPRPSFDVVTGVSTGALMATFAFLGEPQDDAVLRDVYLHLHDKDIFDGPIGGPPDAVFDTAPLRRLIERNVTADALRRIADAHARGRRLYVATVELDTGALYIWPMSRLAFEAIGPRGEVDRRKVERFRQILLAAASIPVLFPPVEIDGGLHVDAGLREAVFLRQSMLGIAKASDAAPRSQDQSKFASLTVWAIFNGQFSADPQAVTADIVHVGIRSLTLYTHAVELMSLRDAAHLAAIHDPAYRFRWICEPSTDAEPPAAPGLLEPMFDPVVMARLYAAGEATAKRGGDAWKDGPPPTE